MKEVIYQAFPELAEIGFTDSRLCWYTDSIDNNFVIDYVPGYSDTLFICTGGSGHGFKFLPVLGRHVKNQIERKRDQFTDIWRWRTKQDGRYDNGLSEGEGGAREMSKVQMATGKFIVAASKISNNVVKQPISSLTNYLVFVQKLGFDRGLWYHCLR